MTGEKLFLKELKEYVNCGMSKNDLKTLINQRLKELEQQQVNVSKRVLGIESVGSLIKSMPLDQAIQAIKSDITGQPQTTVIDGQLVVALAGNGNG